MEKNNWQPGNIVGKGVNKLKSDSDELSKFENYMQKRISEGLEKQEGELKKTEEELYVIEKINQILTQKCKEYEVEKPEIFPDNIHIFESKNDIVGGKYNADAHKIYLDRMKGRRLDEYFVLLEEMIHATSYVSFSISEERNVDKYRLGYLINNNEDGHSHFLGLNEAVTARMFLNILKENELNFTQDLQITEGEIKENKFLVYPYLKVLDFLQAKIAESKKESIENVQKRFEKGMLTGEMMHLRDIEDIFGPGSLRIIASLGSDTKSKFNNHREKESVLTIQFFKTEDQELKNKIAKKLLNERERLQYEKIVGSIKDKLN